MPKPPPFRRPSIDLDFDDRRMWQHIPAGTLRPGDMWAQKGRVRTTERHKDGTVAIWVGLRDEPEVVDQGEIIYAFTGDKSGEVRG